MTRIFHVSDLHFGQADLAALEWFSGAVRDERPDAVIITGDLTMRARSAEYAAASAWLATLSVPLSIEVGNHDLPALNLFKRFFKPYSRYTRMEAAIERPLDLPGVAVVPLRTTSRFQLRTNWAHGVVHRHRVEAAVALLDALDDDVMKIVTCHHPLVGERTRGGTRAVAALARAGADLILSGHVHDPFDRMWSDGVASTRLVGAGTLSERTRATPPSFNAIEMENGAIDVAVRALS